MLLWTNATRLTSTPSGSKRLFQVLIFYLLIFQIHQRLQIRICRVFLSKRFYRAHENYLARNLRDFTYAKYQTYSFVFDKRSTFTWMHWKFPPPTLQSPSLYNSLLTFLSCKLPTRTKTPFLCPALPS